MKRTLFLALGLVFLFLLIPSATSETVGSRWVVAASDHIVQPQVMVKFTMSGPGSVTFNYQVDPFCSCGIAGWGYFKLEHRPRGSNDDNAWDSDPTHYGPYRPWGADQNTDLTPSNGDGQLSAWRVVSPALNGVENFEFRIVGHPKFVVHANSTPAQILTVQVSTSTGALSGTNTGQAVGGTTQPPAAGGVEDCVNNRMWHMTTAQGGQAGSWYFKNDGTVQGIDPMGRIVWNGTWRFLGHYRYSFQFDYNGSNIQYVTFVDSQNRGHADLLDGYSDASMRNLNRLGRLAPGR